MTKISKYDIWIIIAGYLAAMNVGKLSPIIPILQQELGLSFTQAGFSLSLVQGAGMLFALTIGAFSEKVGLKRCLIAGLIILGCSSSAGFFVDNVISLYIFRFGEGIGFLMVSICAPAILKRISSAETLNFKLGLWSSYMGVGVSLAVFSIPIFLEWFSWQEVWVMLGLISFALALIIYHLLQLDQPVQQQQQHSSFWEIFKITATHPPVLCLAFIFSCYTGQWITVVGFLPSMYVAENISFKLAGILVSIVVIANLIGTFSAGTLLQRGIAPARLLSVGFISMLVTSFMTFAATAWLAFEWQYIAAILFSLLGGLIPTTVFAITLKYAPRANAAAASVGLVLQISACAQFLVPPLSAAVVSHSQQWSQIAFITAILSCIGLAMTYILLRFYAVKK
ncbi:MULTISPECIES: MFS transporter [unclassified Acinetobacter]|uniref:MFS transporter n=1 Tax=unclassified Acinetobacter TaxID=196816 RepID=UPI002934C7C1|nr:MULTISPECIES: MFS transporter [unclassified Acinetobacter]WOE31186.1 MFS transporter [Acinetobacter sp. SAAs470]WOE39382.1 MFS transporter [Acinetobacter sp. SAAs474]